MEGVASNNGRGSNDGGSDQAAAAAATATATATATKDKDTDEFLSDELFKMNLEDRETIHEEIHGVRCAAPDESAAFLESSLEEFEKALGALPSHKTSSYRRCLAAARQRQQKQQQQKQQQQQQHNYAVHDRDFRLRFLRCELFDAPRAALRFANYLSFVNDLWGPVALEREIRFSDFTTEEAKIFRKGYYQLLPVRDQSGRRVIVFLGGMGFSPDTNERARAKILFYLWNSVTLGDVESQRKGAVVVVDITCWKGITIQNASPPRDSREVMVRSFAAIPTRIAAMHVCLPDRPFSRIVKSLIALDATGRSQRQRIRFHLQEEGSGHLYVRYRLKGYGIPVELVPMTESGTITTKHHSQWLKTRHLFEGGGMAGSVGGGGGGTKPNTFPEPVDCPRSNDVLFRQGKDMMEHPGNKMFRDLILSSLAHQEALKKRMRPSSLPNPETENNRSDPNREASPAAEATPTATPLETLFAPGAANHANDDATASALAFGKHRFVNSWILDEILDRRGGRFLEWDRRNTVWYVMTDIPTIKNKISVVYSKYRKRSEAASKKKKKKTDRTTDRTTASVRRDTTVGSSSSSSARKSTIRKPRTMRTETQTHSRMRMRMRIGTVQPNAAPR